MRAFVRVPIPIPSPDTWLVRVRICAPGRWRFASALDPFSFMVGDEIEKINKRSVTYHHWTDALEATHEFPCTISVWRLTAAKARLVAHACTHTNTGTARAHSHG